MDHELLERKYVNDETMLCDAIAGITQEKLVSEDGYARDIDELAQTITANAGTVRNPLSRQMFTPDGIHLIVQHASGKASSAAIQLEQSKLKNGVRQQNVDAMLMLKIVLLNDQAWIRCRREGGWMTSLHRSLRSQKPNRKLVIN